MRFPDGGVCGQVIHRSFEDNNCSGHLLCCRLILIAVTWELYLKESRFDCRKPTVDFSDNLFSFRGRFADFAFRDCAPLA